MRLITLAIASALGLAAAHPALQPGLKVNCVESDSESTVSVFQAAYEDFCDTFSRSSQQLETGQVYNTSDKYCSGEQCVVLWLAYTGANKDGSCTTGTLSYTECLTHFSLYPAKDLHTTLLCPSGWYLGSVTGTGDWSVMVVSTLPDTFDQRPETQLAAFENWDPKADLRRRDTGKNERTTPAPALLGDAITEKHGTLQIRQAEATQPQAVCSSYNYTANPQEVSNDLSTLCSDSGLLQTDYNGLIQKHWCPLGEGCHTVVIGYSRECGALPASFPSTSCDSMAQSLIEDCTTSESMFNGGSISSSDNCWNITINIYPTPHKRSVDMAEITARELDSAATLATSLTVDDMNVNLTCYNGSTVKTTYDDANTVFTTFCATLPPLLDPVPTTYSKSDCNTERCIIVTGVFSNDTDMPQFPMSIEACEIYTAKMFLDKCGAPDEFGGGRLIIDEGWELDFSVEVYPSSIEVNATTITTLPAATSLPKRTIASPLDDGGVNITTTCLYSPLRTSHDVLSADFASFCSFLPDFLAPLPAYRELHTCATDGHCTYMYLSYESDGIVPEWPITPQWCEDYTADIISPQCADVNGLFFGGTTIIEQGWRLNFTAYLEPDTGESAKRSTGYDGGANITTTCFTSGSRSVSHQNFADDFWAFCTRLPSMIQPLPAYYNDTLCNQYSHCTYNYLSYTSDGIVLEWPLTTEWCESYMADIIGDQCANEDGKFYGGTTIIEYGWQLNFTTWLEPWDEQTARMAEGLVSVE